jgi:eukaryotic-like serine/threonine-protein kinase
VGKNVSEATSTLRSKGLLLRVADRTYSELPMNVVVKQSPPAGMLMKVQQQAHVVLSLGQRQLEIPSIEGNSLRASRIELLREGLQIGEVSAVPMLEPTADTVVIQHPKPGTSAATPRVDVLVSGGPREQAYVMPHFIGLNEADAQHRLDTVGMKRSTTYVSAPQWPRGTVIDQTPAAGTRVGASSTISLMISN